jgi:hypothetical protein
MKRVPLYTMLLALLFVGSTLASPARAQFGGDQMQQFAPLLNTMKGKLGKKRFGQVMQIMGPTMSQLAETGSFNFGADPMEQFGPLLEIMKERLGRQKFARLMQMVGPMMSNMMDRGGGFGNFESGDFDVNSLSGMINADNIASIEQMIGSRGGHRRAAKHKKPAAPAAAAPAADTGAAD